MANCGCPSGFTLLPDGTCQKINSAAAVAPTETYSITHVPDNSNPLRNIYACRSGAVIYDDITTKQWPLITVPQINGNTNQATPSSCSSIDPSGSNPNPFIVGGASYTSVSPALPNYPIDNKHFLLLGSPFVPALPNPWPPLPFTQPVDDPCYDFSLYTIRESVINNSVLTYGSGPVLNPQTFLSNPVWSYGTSLPDCETTGSWFNEVGITCGLINYDSNYYDKWFGFTTCVTITTQKTYYLAACANNAFRIKINGRLAVEVNVGDGVGLALGFANIFPITLPIGTHIFTIEFLNYYQDGGLAFEIYDATIQQLSTVTQYASPGLSDYKIFSTNDKVGNIFDVGEEVSIYPLPEPPVTLAPGCPEGYTYSTCGEAKCYKIQRQPFVTCNYLLTPCCDIPGEFVISKNDLLPIADYVGKTICLTGISPFNSCWQVSETGNAPTITSPKTITFVTVEGCGHCPRLNCPDCVNYYYELRDCCTNELYKDEYGNIIRFRYNGVALPGMPLPSDYPDQAIQEIKTPIGATLAEGCLKLSLAQYDPEVTNYLQWSTNVGTITAIDPTFTQTACEICVDCRTCYKLTNCRDSTDFIITYTVLSFYLGKTVVLLGDISSKCYFVTVYEDRCTPTAVAVNIKEEYKTCWDCNPCYALVDCSNPDNTITSIQDLSAYLGQVVTIGNEPGCWLIKKNLDCQPPYTTISIIQGYPLCSKCRGCFILTDCEDPTNKVYTIDPNLAQYVGMTISIIDSMSCWIVSQDPNCIGENITINVAQSYGVNGCELCLPVPKPPKLTNERPVKPGYIKPVCPNNCESGCSACNSCNN